MYYVRLLAVALIVIFAVPPLTAQDDSTQRAEQLKAAFQAHKADFDYLLGDWEFTAESRDYGKFSGRWSAVRLEGEQILDEYRVLGKDGQTVYMTATIRSYNAAADRWELIGMNSGNGLQDFGTGQRVGPEIHLEQKFGVSGGKPKRCASDISTFSRINSLGSPTAWWTAANRGRRATRNRGASDRCSAFDASSYLRAEMMILRRVLNFSKPDR